MGEAKLFNEIKFIIAQCEQPEDIKNKLIENGAKHINYISEHVTLVISDTYCPEAEEAVELYDKPVVKTLWVHQCLKTNKLLPFEAFSPTRAIFREVVAFFSDEFTKNDVDVLASTLTFYGACVTKNVTKATHIITSKDEAPSQAVAGEHQGQPKLVDPGWVIESVRSNSCCDEQFYNPKLLLPPPPPKPPTPPPAPAPTIPQLETSRDTSEIKPTSQTQTPENHPDSQATNQSNQIQLNHVMQSQQPPNLLLKTPPAHLSQGQALRSSHNNQMRSPQPRFRPILPSNAQYVHRGQVQQIRLSPDSQQPKKVILNYGAQYKRAPGPYPNNVGPQDDIRKPIHMNQPHQQGPSNMMPAGMVHQNMYQIRGPQNSQRPHMVAQQGMMNQQQPPQMMSPMPVDPNSNMSNHPHPYQVSLQPQTSSNYPHPIQNNPTRLPVYYNQPQVVEQQMMVRVPQSSPPRRMQPVQVMYDKQYVPTNQQSNPPQHPQQVNYHHHHQQQHPQQQVPQPHHMQQQQQHQSQMMPMQQVAQPGQPQMHQHHHSQPIPQQQPQIQPQPHTSSQPQNFIPPQQLHSTGGLHPRPQYHQGYANVGLEQQQQGVPRPIYHNQPEVMHFGDAVRMPHPSQVIANQDRTQVAIGVQQKPIIRTPAQPLPSIFNTAKESSLALLKSKVPNFNEEIKYFDYEDPNEIVPEGQPLHGCSFKMIDYDYVNPKVKSNWQEVIKDAGGVFVENLSDATHLICENRLSSDYSEAIKLGVRCVTINWIDDCLEKNRISYPWRASHIPLPFSSDNQPLKHHILAVTNFQGKQRKLVRDMILKTGAKYTDFFGSSNTLLICASVGGKKYERAIDWRVPIANCQLLNDLILGTEESVDILLDRGKYQIFNDEDPLKLTSYAAIREVMSGWTKPIVMKKKDLEPVKMDEGGTAP